MVLASRAEKIDGLARDPVDHQALSAWFGAQAQLDPPQALVADDREQRGHDRAGHDLLAEILGDALEDDVAEPAGIDEGRRPSRPRPASPP